MYDELGNREIRSSGMLRSLDNSVSWMKTDFILSRFFVIIMHIGQS
jgi:hypothetical protein